MRVPLETLEKLIEKHGSYLDGFCEEYGEPGYAKENDGYILFANWNDLPAYLVHHCEKYHDIEWSDEWIVIYDTMKAYRTSPDGWDWIQSWVIIDGECVGRDQIDSDPDLQADYIESLVNNPAKCDIFGLELEKYGFSLIQGDFENGLHQHQTDDPKSILKQMQADHPDKEFIFSDMVASQFGISFSIYGRVKQ